MQTGYLHADETGIKVLDNSKAGKKIHNGFFWVCHNSIEKPVFFDYQKTRSKEAPQGILQNYTGHLQSDGYEAMMTLIAKKASFLCIAWLMPADIL